VIKINFRIDRYKIAALFLLAVSLGLFVVLYSGKKELNSMFSEAADEYKLRNYQKAVDVYKQINVRYHGSAEAEEAALRAAEIYYFNINNHRLSIQLLERLIAGGEYAEYVLKAKILLARIYSEETGQLEDALLLLREANRMEIAVNYRHEIFLLCAKICSSMGYFKRASGYYNDAIKLIKNPSKLIDAKIHLAAAYTAMFERKKAEKVFRELLTMKELTDSQRSRIELQLFQNLDEQDRFEDALEIINVVISRDPTNEFLLRERKRIREEIQFIKEAKTHRW